MLLKVAVFTAALDLFICTTGCHMHVLVALSGASANWKL